MMSKGMPVEYVVAYLLDRIERDQRMMFFCGIGVAESPLGLIRFGGQVNYVLSSVLRSSL
jgi:hypothetical protein